MRTPYKNISIPEGVTVCQVSEYHWQVQGKILINHYPLSKQKTAYIQNTTSGIKGVTEKQVLQWANNPNKIPRNRLPEKVKRKFNYKRQRNKLLKRGITNCFWCGKPLGDDVTLEHIVPLSKGGLDCESNWTLAHHKCNQEHGDKIEVSV